MSDVVESIWDAKNNLGYNEPLEVNSPLFVDTASARGDFNINRLYRDLNIDNQGNVRSPPRKQYMLFTGHRGCGKSTELLRVADYLHAPERYYVIHLDCLRKLDTNNLKYSDILLALAAALLEQLETEAGITIEQVHLTKLEDWYKERIESHTKMKDLATEIKAGAKGETGLPWVGKLFAELTNKINIGSSYREELRLVVRESFTEFAKSFNHLIQVAEEKINARNLGQRILFTIDGTDRLDSDDAHEFFIENVHQLTLIQSLFIYAAPIHLLHEGNQLSSNFGKVFRVPMLKIRDRQDQPLEGGYQVMREMTYKRIPEQFFDSPETVDYLIEYSGGHPRDLVRLLSNAITYTDEEQITLDAAKDAVKELANDYRRIITSDSYERLVNIDLNPDTPDDFTDELSSKMLFNLLVLEYNNYFWKSHPVITTLPGYKKALEHAEAA